jgi:hypothetical protein
MISLESSNFDSFNARSLKPYEVARTFVPSRHFSALSKRRHTIILGPRGSGKTTLLKMLQPQALEAWNHPSSESFRQSVDFTGVFVATDISWGEQIKSLGGGKLEDDLHRLLSIATFTTHVLRALTATFINRKAPYDPASGKHLFKRVELSAQQEANLVTQISRRWHTDTEIPSLLSLKHSLSERLSDIKELASREINLGVAGRPERISQIRYLHLHFVQSCSSAVELFDDIIGEPDAKWALMFDELELAPKWIQEDLVRSIRSTDERFLFKLAFNPYHLTPGLLESPLSPAADQDFEPIPLWYSEKRDSYEFCSNLLHQMLAERHLPNRPAKKLLGNSYFETIADEWKDFGTTYQPGSRIASRFEALAERDKSFREYLAARAIDVKALHLVAGDKRASELRKIAPVVALREFYRGRDLATGQDPSGRSRKTAALYSGAESLFAVSEGNPRWFISILDRMLDSWDDTKDRIPDFIQAQEMQKASERFAAMLKTLPVEGDSPNTGVLGLVKTIARYFNREIVKADFRPEPPGTFSVDDNVPGNLMPTLGQALNAGAIVYIPPDDGQLILTSLRHKRFRVSYLLAPMYGIPIRLGKVVSLSTILGREKDEDKSSKLPFAEANDE